MSSRALWRNATQQARAFGQSLTEYGLVMGLVSIVSIGTLSVLGGQIEQSIQDINGSFSMNGSLALTGVPGGTTTSPGQGNLTNLAPVGTPGSGSIGGGGTSGGPSSGVNPAQGGTGQTGQGNNPLAVINNQPPEIGGSSGIEVPKSPQYQAWLTANPQTAAMIKTLSPEGQTIANEVYQEASATGINGDGPTIILMGKLSPTDKLIFQQFVNTTAQSLGE